MPDLILTPQQQEAFIKINAFLLSDNHQVFMLRGYAGTGKTTLLQQLAMKLKQDRKVFELLAPTGRAAVVLRARTGLETKTIHSALYHFNDVEGEPDDRIEIPSMDAYGQMRLIFTMRMPESDEKKIFIVDEASMVGDENTDGNSYAHFGSGHLLTDLLTLVGKNKLILAGDPCQLPPIGMDTSPALDEYWFRRQGRNAESVELTQILRQKEASPILRIATRLRRLHEQPGDYRFVKLPAGESQSVSILPYESMKSAYVEHLLRHGHDDTIAICHSNTNVADINKVVRMKKFGQSPPSLTIDEVLMVTQNNYRVPLTNGDFVKVTHVGAAVRHDSGIRFQEVVVKAMLSGEEHQVLLCTEPLAAGQPNLRLDQQRHLMIDFSKRMRKEGLRPKTDAYFEALQKDPYLNSLRANYGYAVTCHKSQGGEWDTVFLFLNKSMYTLGRKGVLRWWYTGVTRARVTLILADDWWIDRI
jgi:hypothetical protein